MGSGAQGSLFDDGLMAPPPRTTSPNPVPIRDRLNRLLAVLRAAETMPLSEKDVRMWKTVVPNMTRWLPEADAVKIRAALDSEWRRLGA